MRPGRCRQPGSPEQDSAGGPGTRRSGPPPGAGGPASTCQSRQRDSGSKPAGSRKAQEGRVSPCRGRAGRAPREDPLLGAYPARPTPVPHPPRSPSEPRSPTGPEAGPPRPRSAPLRSPLARAAAASLPGRLREGRGGAGPRMQITPAGRCPAYVDCPPGAGHGIQINLSCGLSALSSAAVMNNSARRSLGANQKAATAPRCLAQIELAAAPHPEPPPPRGEPDTEHRPRPGVASRENRLPCRVRPPPPGSVRPPAPRGAGT